MIIKRCRKCKHEWRAHIENPIQCPKCKSHLWNRDDQRTGPKEFKERNRPTAHGVEKLEVGQKMELPFIRKPGEFTPWWAGHDDLANEKRARAIYAWGLRNGKKFTLEGNGRNLLIRRLF